MNKPQLTPREKEIAHAILKYHGNQSVAIALSISISTVKFHATAIRDKIGVRNTMIAVQQAYKNGLLD